MKQFLINLLSNNTQSSIRLGLLIGLLITVAISIVVIIISFKYAMWGLSLDVLDKLTYFVGVVLSALVIGKVAQKFAEVKQDNTKPNG